MWKFIILLVITLFSCNTKTFKYKVYNQTYFNQTKQGVFYTDTIEIDDNKIGYHDEKGKYILMSNNRGKDLYIDTLKKN